MTKEEDMMQIVIEVPKCYYEYCKSQEDVIEIQLAVKNGIPLPKGHGRISDMDEAIKCIEEVTGGDAIWAIGLIEWACSKRTLIEADNEGEE